MITADQIRAMIQQLTLFNITLDDFEDWLTAASWNMHQGAEQDAVSMAGKIELELAEMDAGHKSQADILKEFAMLAGLFEMGDAPPVRIFSGSGNAKSFRFNGLFQLWADADKQHGMEFSYTPLLPASQ
jgi:hypothetical protein